MGGGGGVGWGAYLVVLGLLHLGLKLFGNLFQFRVDGGLLLQRRLSLFQILCDLRFGRGGRVGTGGGERAPLPHGGQLYGGSWDGDDQLPGRELTGLAKHRSLEHDGCTRDWGGGGME